MTLPQPVYNEIKEYILTAYDTILAVPEGAQFLPDAVWRGTSPGRPVIFAKIDNTLPATVQRRFLAVRSTQQPDPIPQGGTYLGRVFNSVPLTSGSIVAHIFEIDLAS